MSDNEVSPLLRNAALPDDVKGSRVGRSTVTVGEEDVVINGGCLLGTEPVCSTTVYFSIIACVTGTSFSFGFGLGSLNTPAKVMKEVYSGWYNDTHKHSDLPISDTELTFLWSATVSIFCLGGFLSGSLGGALADKLGRKRCMLLMNPLNIAGALLMFSSLWIHRYEMIIAGRFVCGLYAGLATVVCPLYLNEISPQAQRGKFGTVHQLVIVFSLTLGQVIGIQQLLGTSDRFYYIPGLLVIPAIAHWVLLAFCPESPSWLYLYKKDKDGARQALERLRDSSVTSSVNDELAEFHKEELKIASEPKVSLNDMFTTYRRRPLLIVVVMHASQQLGGINAVVFYSTIIFVGAGLSHSTAQYATLSLGVVMLIMTVVTLVAVERLGRRTLHLHGMGLAFIALCLLTAFLLLGELPHLEWMSYVCIFSVALYVIVFSVGPAPIPWFYTSELFDFAATKWAISIATAVNWISNFIVGVTFPYLHAGLGNYAFLPFMVVLAVSWTFLYYRAPETKNRSTLEITEQFKTEHSVASLPAAERRHYRTFASA